MGKRLKAADPLTGEIKKSVHLSYPNFSGTLATGGGIVFLALLDGTVAAFDDTTLDELWKINVGSGRPDEQSRPDLRCGRKFHCPMEAVWPAERGVCEQR
jgi:glucose dehydrogenase